MTSQPAVSPRVSVICAFYNCARFLDEAIASVVAQDFADFELLLVDDGSNDGSTELAKAWVERDPARILYSDHPQHENRGVTISRNCGLEQARGEYVAFIDSDDVWRPGKLAHQVACLDRDPDCALLGGKVNYWASWDGGRDRIIQSGGVRPRTFFPPEALSEIYPLGLASAPGPSEVMLRRKVIEQVGGFEPAFSRSQYEDQVLFAKIYLTAKVGFTDQVLVDYRLCEDSMSEEIRRAGLQREHRRLFFAWLDQYLTQAEQPLPAGLAVRVKREALWLRFPLLWAFVWRLRAFRGKIARSN